MRETEREPPPLDRLRQRDEAAFTWLVNEHQSLVLALGQSLGLSGPDLDDAAAEVFAGIYQALPRFEGRSALRTWVYRIALRILTRFRQRARRNPAPLPPEGLSQRSEPPPGLRLEENEMNQRVWAAVARLDAKQAAVIELHYRQGWPLDQIAQALPCPVGTVKTLLFRARQRLRELLERES